MIYVHPFCNNSLFLFYTIIRKKERGNIRKNEIFLKSLDLTKTKHIRIFKNGRFIVDNAQKMV